MQVPLLARVRREAGLTQAELARRAETSQAMVARYEDRSGQPDSSDSGSAAPRSWA